MTWWTRGNDICLVGCESLLLKSELCHMVNQHTQTKKRVIPERSYRESMGQGEYLSLIFGISRYYPFRC